MRTRLSLPFFYGWLLVAIAFVTMAVGVNARTAFSLLFPSILDEFGWDQGVTAGIFSFGFLVSAFVTPCVGWLVDRRLSLTSASLRWRRGCCWRRSRMRRGSCT
jgi:MFS family permease